jgi:hypothetical protein
MSLPFDCCPSKLSSNKLSTNSGNAGGKGEFLMATKKSLSTVLALTAGLVVAATSVPAFATVTCAPTAVNSDNATNVTISCGGVWYFVQPGKCANSLDSTKMFMSTVDAAILSGKNIQVNTNTASGCTNHVIWLEMDK